MLQILVIHQILLPFFPGETRIEIPEQPAEGLHMPPAQLHLFQQLRNRYAEILFLQTAYGFLTGIPCGFNLLPKLRILILPFFSGHFSE